MLKFRPVFLVLMFVLLVPLHSYSASETLHDYFPEPGTIKTFEGSENSYAVTMLGDAEFDGKSVKAYSAIINPDTSTSVENIFYYEINDNDYRVLGNNISGAVFRYSPPIIFYMYPFKTGLKWESNSERVLRDANGDHLQTSKIKIWSTVTGQETVKVPAGTFHCWVVEAIFITDNRITESVKITSYITPGVGSVLNKRKQMGGRENSQTLKSISVATSGKD